jgi:hypothetical protein
MYEVKEGKNSYFMITNHFGIKKMDMMRIDTELTFKDDLKILANNFIGI